MSHVKFQDPSEPEEDHEKPPPSPPPPLMSNLTPKFASKELRANLMREIKDRDPLFYYDVVTVLGVGSMGSVSRVRKRKEAVGGSARAAIQQHFAKEKKLKACFELPLVGGLFKYCLKNQVRFDTERSIIGESTRSASVAGSQHPMEDFNDGHQLGPDEGVMYAMKSIHLSRVTDPNFVQELRNEVSVLRTLDHPHIVRPIETFEHRNQLFIVMELCTGGDLYGRDPYTEEEAARIISSILSAISYMHSKNIIHRDLKYENIIFSSNDPKAEIKLIDFGLSKKYGNEDELTEGVGTIYTMAPEVLKGNYTEQADLWSVGVIAYMLLSSQMPFYGKKRRHIVEQIMNGEYAYKGRRWRKISAQAKAFVDELLVINPEERATADEAFSANWLNRRMTATVRNPNFEEEEKSKNSIQRYAKYSKLKRVALMVIAHKSTTTEIGILRKIFQKYDTKRDGQLSYEEFKLALADAGLQDEDQFREIFDAVDLDGTGQIRYTEFLAATIEAQGAISEERLAEAFDRIDADDSGYIDAKNLREMLGADFPQEEIDAIIKETTKSKDGRISYADFLALWEDKHEDKRKDAMLEIRSLLRDDSTSVSSPLSVDDADDSIASDEDIVARANFLSEKRLSERRNEESPVASTKKKVLFSESTTTIPTEIPVIIESDKEEPEPDQNEEASEQPSDADINNFDESTGNGTNDEGTVSAMESAGDANDGPELDPSSPKKEILREDSSLHSLPKEEVVEQKRILDLLNESAALKLDSGPDVIPSSPKSPKRGILKDNGSSRDLQQEEVFEQKKILDLLNESAKLKLEDSAEAKEGDQKTVLDADTLAAMPWLA